MSARENRDRLAEAIAAWGRAESSEPAHITARMIIVKAQLARTEAAEARVKRLSRWAFGGAGAVLIGGACLLGTGPMMSSESTAGIVLLLTMLTLGTSSLARMLQA